ncbi:PREDICTED: peroxidasin-like protein [Ceratosolen solmsi marchali]|uniref:Peroxidasin-like protein n=1 Tax=Ceratosolen solmsi marchali TaxID=326594 RepID=A0AAJ6YWD7_9HYME|nr:PREDICTED: peroxidasin-like protein [Ceratosolen solmsi marchali]
MSIIFIILEFSALLWFAQATILPARILQDLKNRTNSSMIRYQEQERIIMDSDARLSRNSPAWYLAASHEMVPAAKNLTEKALRRETMAVMLVEALHMSAKDALSILPSVGTSLVSICSGDYLRIISDCKKTEPRYRTHTGRCNNPFYPARGAALEAYSRILLADYADGVSLPAPGLPSARAVSTAMHSGGPDLSMFMLFQIYYSRARHPHLMALTALFGEFVAHDLAHTPRMNLPNGDRLRCCDVEFEHFHPECFPIRAEDEVGGCMEYARSAPHPGNAHQGCRLGSRQQINQATSYIDLSPLYGSSEETAQLLRSAKGGLLNTQRRNLPMASRDPRTCRLESRAFPCFLSGDSRINENPGLALMHLLFLREHNRIAENLQLLNPHWSDERLYQESRKINIAEMQHITYGEFLPVVLGEAALNDYDLRLGQRGYFQGYDFRVDATISNAAASAGLFFVAALTPKTLDLIDTQSEHKSGERSLLSAFYAPQELYEAGAIDRLIAGATAGHSRNPLPPSLNEVLVERYFHDGKTRETPVDYAAQIIQQGRDHGLPAYIHWRSVCNLQEVQSFKDLEGTVARDVISRLQGIYRKVEEIDLVTGALSETPLSGSVLGPTFICLLGRTFHNARFGDRYWYENGKTPGTFTPEQLQEIRKTTMARILCDNGDRLKHVQPRAFILKDKFLNNMENCSMYQHHEINLLFWKENPTKS